MNNQFENYVPSAIPSERATNLLSSRQKARAASTLETYNNKLEMAPLPMMTNQNPVNNYGQQQQLPMMTQRRTS